MTVMHSYIVELYQSGCTGTPTFKARTIVMAENDTSAQHQAIEWMTTAAALSGSTYLRLRHDSRIVTDRNITTL